MCDCSITQCRTFKTAHKHVIFHTLNPLNNLHFDFQKTFGKQKSVVLPCQSGQECLQRTNYAVIC